MFFFFDNWNLDFNKKKIFFNNCWQTHLNLILNRIESETTHRKYQNNFYSDCYNQLFTFSELSLITNCLAKHMKPAQTAFVEKGSPIYQQLNFGSAKSRLSSQHDILF